MIVSQIIGDCPNCSAERCFGNVLIRSNVIIRGCMNCNYKVRLSLPKIRKKILYLDQCFFSSAFRDSDKRFAELTRMIMRASSHQLLVAPFSSVHEDETHQWRGYKSKNAENLLGFIKKCSMGHEFKPSYEVDKSQIERAFLAFINEERDDFCLAEDDALDQDVHNWSGYFWVDISRYVGDVDYLRSLKQQSVEGLVNLFPSWRNSKSSYEEDFSAEIQAVAQGYMNSYLDYKRRINNGDFGAILDAPIMSRIVESLLGLAKSESTLQSRYNCIYEFFRSKYFAEIPFVSISANIHLTLKNIVKNGGYRDKASAIRRLRGYFFDVKHVSTYAPYCDAIFVDNAMAEIVTQDLVDLENSYSVKVFSLNNMKSMSDWINSLEEAMSTEHLRGLETAYPRSN